MICFPKNTITTLDLTLRSDSHGLKRAKNIPISINELSPSYQVRAMLLEATCHSIVRRSSWKSQTSPEPYLVCPRPVCCCSTHDSRYFERLCLCLLQEVSYKLGHTNGEIESYHSGRDCRKLRGKKWCSVAMDMAEWVYYPLQMTRGRRITTITTCGRLKQWEQSRGYNRQRQ